MATRFSSVEAPVFRMWSTVEWQSDTKSIGTSRARSCHLAASTAGSPNASAKITRRYTALSKHFEAAALSAANVDLTTRLIVEELKSKK